MKSLKNAWNARTYNITGLSTLLDWPIYMWSRQGAILGCQTLYFSRDNAQVKSRRRPTKSPIETGLTPFDAEIHREDDSDMPGPVSVTCHVARADKSNTP